MWLLRLTIRLPRPFARAWNRLNVGASSISMRATLSVSMSALWLFSALAIEHRALLRREAQRGEGLAHGLAPHHVRDEAALLRRDARVLELCCDLHG
jgi:hypothetical protein